MPKTIVNIIAENNPVPAYLFIKEMYKEGDSVLLISTKSTEEDLDIISNLVETGCTTTQITLEENDEYYYEKICRTIAGKLNKDDVYYVNLAGGTRYLAIALQQAFEQYNSTYFYVAANKNIIINSKFDHSIFDNDDYIVDIKYRMNVGEYFKIHGLSHDLDHGTHTPIRGKEDSERIFEMFSKSLLANRDFRILEILRTDYRGMEHVNIKDIKNPQSKHTSAIPDIESFLQRISFTPEKKGILSKEELDYLTGGWWEEYVYYKAIDYFSPHDIVIGPIISTNGVKRKNELDVVFIKDNRLHVIECKTGVQTERLFNEIVYKTCALKESLLGPYCRYFICSMKKDKNKELARIASNMGITFWDYDTVTSGEKFKTAFKNIEQQP